MTRLVREKVWDPVTRLWHWVFALVVATGWGLGRFMEFETVRWHFYLGYCVLGLLAFRYLWGFLGPRPVRYRALLPSPRATLAYLRRVGRREPSGVAGHNPLGAWSVVAMLLAITAQAATGLFIESEAFFEYGPLAGYVPERVVSFMTGWHHRIADLVLVLAALHVAAILFYLLWKREDLVRPMITGWKLVRRGRPPEDSG